MSNLPISVALCTYNGARYLLEQLASIAKQSCLPEELVVSDDGSTDGTLAIVEEFARTAPFLVRSAPPHVNLGVTQNFAHALALCQGELIALCDQDDVWMPDKLLVCSDFLRAHPECLAVFTNATATDERLVPLPAPSSLWERLHLTEGLLGQIADPATSLQVLTPNNYVTGATLVIRRELLRFALPIPEQLPAKMIHDGWLAAVAAALGRLVPLATPTIFYRQHSGQQVGLATKAAPRQSLNANRERFASLAITFERLHHALAPRIARGAVPGAFDALEDRTTHFRRRGAFPGSPFLRIKPVIREWQRGGYRRYCHHPLLAALRDVIL